MPFNSFVPYYATNTAYLVMLVSHDHLEKTNVTLKMLIESEILSPGLELVCANPNVHGILNSDGSIKIMMDGKEKIFPFLSGAARYIEKRSLNGWIYWQVRNGEGRTDLSAFRDAYIELQKKAG